MEYQSRLKEQKNVNFPTSHVKNLLDKGCFIPGKVKEYSDGDYIKYESDRTLSKTLSVIKYLDETRKHLTNIIKKLKKTGSSWKMNFVIGLYYYYEKDDKIIETEVFIWGVYEVATLKNNH